MIDQDCVADELDTVQSVLLTCKRLVPAATRALYFSPQIPVCLPPRPATLGSPATLERIRYRAWLFRQSLLDKPELAAMIRNLTNLPTLVAALPPSRNIARTASAIAHSVGQNEYQRQVLQLATAATSVGVVLTDPKDAFDVGAVLATRRLSHLRVAYLSSMHAPISAFAALIEGLRSGGDGGVPEFSALQVCMSVDQKYGRYRSYIARARDLNYKVTDLELNIENEDIDEAALFLPSDVTKLARLRYKLLFDLESFDFATTTLEQRVKHNVVTEFTIISGKLWHYDVYQDQYSDPDRDNFATILYPLALFRLFPGLEQLLLSHGTAITIEKLELLAATSPSLKVLRLPLTFWDVDAADLVELECGGLCLFETRLLATLDRLVSLEWVDLGILPFSTNRPAKAFRRWATGRGIRLTASWCMDRGDDDYIQRRSDDGSYFTDESTFESDDFNPDNYSSDGFDFGFGYVEARSSPPRGYAPSW